MIIIYTVHPPVFHTPIYHQFFENENVTNRERRKFQGKLKFIRLENSFFNKVIGKLRPNFSLFVSYSFRNEG